MPELPEVEVLVRHLIPLLRSKTIHSVRIHRVKIIAPASVRNFTQAVRGAKFSGVSRRGKYLVFNLRAPQRVRPLVMLGHLGMTGRMYLLPAAARLPKHAAVVLGLGRTNFVFEDTRYFGRLTLDPAALGRLGPEPLGAHFTVEYFVRALARSRHPIKVKLLDQSLVAGIGNIYASESLFHAGIAPTLPARELTLKQAARLWGAIRDVLTEAVECGSTVPLNFAGTGSRDTLFYFGRAPGAPDFYKERLCVYDRLGQPCPKCGTAIKRCFQAARSTFHCPRCQPRSQEHLAPALKMRSKGPHS